MKIAYCRQDVSEVWWEDMGGWYNINDAVIIDGEDLTLAEGFKVKQYNLQ